MAMVEQTLEQEQLHVVKAHIGSCPACRMIVAAAVGSGSTAMGTPSDGGGDDLEPVMPLSNVRINDRYVIDRMLGRGGMGTVYLARDHSLGREVALKVHRAGSGNDRLHREAIAMAKLAHPNVVAVFEVATVDDRLYVAMEYIRGETLRGWLAAAQRNWRDIIEILVDTGKGLAAAHAAGLVHRDFKPENVLVGTDKRPRVSDFGLARTDTRPSAPILPLAGSSSVDTPMTQTGALVGTPAYMSPEQLGSGVIDARSDQFAFCVVAWECLFGSRPFTGTTLAALALAIERQVLQPPARTEVPPRVRKIIERGLSLDPANRYPDMPALLADLRDAAAPRSRRYLALGLGGAVVLTSAIVLASSGAGDDSRANQCAVDETALTGVWDPSLKTKIKTVFNAAGLEDSAQMFTKVEGVIDDYRSAWLEMRRTACEATRVRGDQSEMLLDLRMTCLDRRRDELKALTHELASADRPVVLGSVRAALGLSTITECGDLAALSGPVRPPDPAIKILVNAERAELATVKALRLLGRIKPARAKIDAVAARSKDFNYKPLEAEILLLQGDLSDRAGDSETAVKLLEQAVVAADAGNHRFLAAQAWSTLAWIQGYGNKEFERAEFAVKMAGAAIQSGGGNAELSAQLINYEALILETKGQLEPAKAKYLAALAARERMNQSDTWQLSLVLNDLGGLERKLKDFSSARTHHERALTIRRKIFGERHPYVFSSLVNLGTVAWSEENFPEAETRFQAAIAVGEAVFPAKHPQKALVLGNLASVYERQGKYRESADTFRRTVEMYEGTRGPDHADTSDALHNLGNVLFALKDYAKALEAYERSLRILDKSDDDGTKAGVLYDYGDALIVTGAHTKAEQLLKRSIDLGTKASSADEPDLAYALTALGELYLKTKRPRDASPVLERALKLRTKDGVPAAGVPIDELARTELALAKLLWSTPPTRPRALELARTAKSHVDPANPTQREPHQAITQWLAAREK